MEHVFERPSRAYQESAKVVTTLNNPTLSTWALSGTRSTRQKPSQPQPALRKPSLVYKRARYYYSSTGRFSGRDPIGYLDGLNLYRAYFILRAMDPNGLFTCNRANFLDWYNDEKADMDWLDDIPACPCSIMCSVTKTCWSGSRDPTPITYVTSEICNPDSDIWSSPSSAWNIFNRFYWTELWGSYHDGGHYEIRTLPRNHNGHGNQCIYNSDGDLITTTPTAGTADKAAPGSGNGHHEHDVAPYECTQSLGDEYVDKYFEVRPVNGGKPCVDYDLSR